MAAAPGEDYHAGDALIYDIYVNVNTGPGAAAAGYIAPPAGNSLTSRSTSPC